MLSQSRLTVELLTTEITSKSVLAIVVEHVSFQLRVLDEFLATNLTFVIFSSCVRSDVSVECFLGCKSIAAHGTTVGSLACMHSSKIVSIYSLVNKSLLDNLPVLGQCS